MSFVYVIFPLITTECQTTLQQAAKNGANDCDDFRTEFTIYYQITN